MENFGESMDAKQKAILMADLKRHLRNKRITGAKRQAIIAWAERVFFDLGMIENIIEGHAEIKGLDDDVEKEILKR